MKYCKKYKDKRGKTYCDKFKCVCGRHPSEHNDWTIANFKLDLSDEDICNIACYFKYKMDNLSKQKKKNK